MITYKNTTISLINLESLSRQKSLFLGLKVLFKKNDFDYRL